MKKSIASLLFLFTFLVNAQDDLNNDIIEIKGDSIVYNKNTNISESRTFTTNINDKYSGKDFEYKENAPEKKEEIESNSNSAVLDFFFYFMSSIFPFLLGGFVIFIILKTVLGIDARFWKSKKPKASLLSKKLIYEDEDIHELNLESLLKQAIDIKDFRLAIRYYYLSALKKLTNKKVIDYHKDKTNSEYLFEIENKEMRTNFSYLSYVYSYVWYGEFPVDENSFKVAQNKYQSFLKSIV